MLEPRPPARVTVVAVCVGLGWAGWIAGALLVAWVPTGLLGLVTPEIVLSATSAVAGATAVLVARRLRAHPWPCLTMAGLAAALSARPVGSVMGLAEPGPVPWLAVAPFLIGAAFTFLTVAPTRSRVVRTLAVLTAPLLILIVAQPAGAWIASASLTTPTDTMVRSNNVDLSVDTHQWLARQAMTILANDGRSDMASFLATPDPTAPGANDPTSGAATGTTETYGWRLLQGARDADGVLHAQLPDHFHNWWTHQGKWWIVGGSAADGAELAFSHATDAWAAGDRSNAIYWLGAALHLVDDACVPQHEFYGLNVYHHQYERWVQIHQDTLAVDSGGIYADQFRVGTGHGGPAWSSAHPSRLGRRVRSSSRGQPRGGYQPQSSGTVDDRSAVAHRPPHRRHPTPQRRVRRVLLRHSRWPVNRTITAAVAAFGLVISSTIASIIVAGILEGSASIPDWIPPTAAIFVFLAGLGLTGRVAVDVDPDHTLRAVGATAGVVALGGLLAAQVTESHGEVIEPSTVATLAAGLFVLLTVSAAATRHLRRRSNRPPCDEQ